MIEIPNFADVAECRTVIAAYDRCRANAHIYGDPFFDGRVMFISSFPDTENETRRILQNWRNRETAVVSGIVGHQMYPDTIQVVRWTFEEMTPHRDHVDGNGAPNATPWREWAGVIYLNNDFDGGQIYFPETNEYYHPVPGSLVLFPALTLHGVKASRGGGRYTSPAWFTHDVSRQDVLAGAVY